MPCFMLHASLSLQVLSDEDGDRPCVSCCAWHPGGELALTAADDGAAVNQQAPYTIYIAEFGYRATLFL